MGNPLGAYIEITGLSCGEVMLVIKVVSHPELDKHLLK